MKAAVVRLKYCKRSPQKWYQWMNSMLRLFTTVAHFYASKLKAKNTLTHHKTKWDPLIKMIVPKSAPRGVPQPNSI